MLNYCDSFAIHVLSGLRGSSELERPLMMPWIEEREPMLSVPTMITTEC